MIHWDIFQQNRPETKMRDKSENLIFLSLVVLME